MLRNVLLGAAVFLMGVSVSASPVDPRAMWRDGLETIQGTFRYVQVSSPGGMWIDETNSDGQSKSRQGSINEVPYALRLKLESAEIKLSIVPASISRTADQFPTPGSRGQAPYHGHIRKYDESARGILKMKGLPGIGMVDGDAGEHQGSVEFTLFSSVHSDPSDSGVFQERLNAEQIWGAAAQTRNYADLSAVSTGFGSDDPSAQVMANARLLRGGREIIAYIDWVDPSPGVGIAARQVRGSVRLFRFDQ